MATFYVLPARPQLAECFAQFLQAFLPDMDCTSGAGIALAEALCSITKRHRDVFVVFRDDLPADESVRQALMDGFGAEAGDQIVEVDPIRERAQRSWLQAAA